MILLSAPYPAIVTTTALPNPQFSDTEGSKVIVETRRSMNGFKRTYVKTNDRQALSYDFILRRMKSLELRDFILAYYAEKMLLVNHKAEWWLVNCTSNPFEFAADKDIMSITLTFEGILL